MATERTTARERLAAVEVNIEHVIAQVADIKSTVHHTDKAIRGNHGLGLMARTASLEESRDEYRSTRRWLRGVGVAGVITAVGAAIRWLTAK